MPDTLSGFAPATLNAQSTVAEMPAHHHSVDIADKGVTLGELFKQDTQLPGVLVVSEDTVVGAISRSQYFKMVGRSFGIEVYHSRPLGIMLQAIGLENTLLMIEQDCPIQEAVEQCLQRPHKLIYEPFLVKQTNDSGAQVSGLVDFFDLLVGDVQVSNLRNQQMREILSTISDGLFLIDSNFIIAGDYSTSLETIFNRTDLAGLNLSEFLDEILPDDRSHVAKQYLGMLFKPSVIESLITKINPVDNVQVRIRNESGDLLTRHLSFRFARSLTGDEIRNVLVSVTDVTRQVELARELEAQESRARNQFDLMIDLFKADAQELGEFLRKLQLQFDWADSTFKTEPADVDAPLQEALRQFFQGIHALKGDASTLRFDNIARKLHAVEDTIEELQSAPLDLSGCWQKLTTQISELGKLSSDTQVLIKHFSGSGSNRDGAGSKPEKRSRMLAKIEELVARLAGELGKKARFISRVTEAEIPDKYKALIEDLLIQLVRNSMVHGIETEEQRLAKGKPELGILQLDVRRYEEHHEVIYQDDGAGIDLELLKSRAASQELPAESEQDLHDLIYQSGFSTSTELTMHAGRGVGLDLLKSRIEDLGGTIRHYNEPGSYLAFQVLLPRD